MLYTVPRKYSTLNLPHDFFFFPFWVELTAESVDVPSKTGHVSKVLFFTQIKVWTPPTPLKDSKQKICNVF